MKKEIEYNIIRKPQIVNNFKLKKPTKLRNHKHRI